VRQVRDERRRTTKVRVADLLRSRRGVLTASIRILLSIRFSLSLVDDGSSPMPSPCQVERECGFDRRYEASARSVTATTTRGAPRSRERSLASAPRIVFAVSSTVVAIARESAFCWPRPTTSATTEPSFFSGRPLVL